MPESQPVSTPLPGRGLSIPIEEIQFVVKLHYTAFPEPIRIPDVDTSTRVGELRQRLCALLPHIGSHAVVTTPNNIRLIYYGRLLSDNNATVLSIFGEDPIRTSEYINVHFSISQSEPITAHPPAQPAPPVNTSVRLTEAEMEARINAHFAPPPSDSDFSIDERPINPNAQIEEDVTAYIARLRQSMRNVSFDINRDFEAMNGFQDMARAGSSVPDYTFAQYQEHWNTGPMLSALQPGASSSVNPIQESLSTVHRIYDSNNRFVGIIARPPTQPAPGQPSSSRLAQDLRSPRRVAAPDTPSMFRNTRLYAPAIPHESWTPYAPQNPVGHPLPPPPPEALLGPDPLGGPTPIPRDQYHDAVNTADLANYNHMPRAEEPRRQQRPANREGWWLRLFQNVWWPIQFGFIAVVLLMRSDSYFRTTILVVLMATAAGIHYDLIRFDNTAMTDFLGTLVPRIDRWGRPAENSENNQGQPPTANADVANPTEPPTTTVPATATATPTPGAIPPADQNPRRTAHVNQMNAIVSFTDSAWRIFMLFVASMYPQIVETHVRNLRRRKEEAEAAARKEEEERKKKEEEEKKRLEEEAAEGNGEKEGLESGEKEKGVDVLDDDGASESHVAGQQVAEASPDVVA